MIYSQNAMMPLFDWYAIVPATTQLEQGDLLNNFPIIVPPTSVADLANAQDGFELSEEAKVERFNVVVMTQSCDLQRLKDQDEVILCPRHGYLEMCAVYPKLRGKDGWSSLIKGRIIGVYPLKKCDVGPHEFDYQVVDFRRIFSVPLSLVRRLAEHQGPRVRLLPPYRERMAQEFARQFMRIGLPDDLPRAYPYDR